MLRAVAKGLLVVGLCVGILGCESKAGTGALIGGAGGGLLGAGIGSMSHGRAGEGALIGAAAGAIGGALIGGAMDGQDKKDREAREQQDRIYTEREYSKPNYDNPAVPQQDVITWSQRGTRDEIIIDRIERSNTVYHLTAADENHLRDAGVSERVIQAMRDTARR